MAVIADTTLIAILTNPRVIGKTRDDVTAQWPPVFKDADEWKEMCAILKAKPRGRAREGGVYMLTGGVLKCGVCGNIMYAQPTNGGTWVGGTRAQGGRFEPRRVPTYSCRKTLHHAGGCVSMAVAQLDDAVMRQISDFLTPFVRVSEDPTDLWKFRTATFLKSPTLAAASVEMEKVLDDERRIAELLGDGLLDKAGYVAAKGKLAPRLKAAKSALDAAEGQAAGLNELAQLDPAQFVAKWQQMPMLERRRVVLTLVSEIRVRPHKGQRNTLDLDRVEIRYRPEVAL